MTTIDPDRTPMYSFDEMFQFAADRWRYNIDKEFERLREQLEAEEKNLPRRREDFLIHRLMATIWQRFERRELDGCGMLLAAFDLGRAYEWLDDETDEGKADA